MVKPSLSPRTLLLARRRPAALPAAVSALWLYSAHRIPMEIDAWAERERQAGISVHWDALAVGGFPLRLQVSLLNATYGKSLRPPLYTVTTPAAHRHGLGVELGRLEPERA